ncbi:OmpH family outer membrane protein [uncultured Parabacteroides sp.]|uniref:OmpH family outer membrane protein n=1 Tax=uncultured Parabacteroides sp. TaxID=512312 RepID=UPI0025F8F3CC|nr:OmpH family outer membrane protein [uncultured Parabacteroides sp.]MCD7849702.1 OmpH family outer membrane protein [Parabacteroides sp.]
MKKLIIFLLMMLPLSLFAQESKIAVVNTQEVIQAMPEFADMQKQMTDMEAKYKNEMQVMQDEYNKKYSDFVAQQDSLTENIKMRRMQELQDMEQRTQNFIQISQQDFQKKQGELFAPIQEKLKKAIDAVGAEKGYTYILDPQIVLFSGNSAIDATQFVKAKLGIN